MVVKRNFRKSQVKKQYGDFIRCGISINGNYHDFNSTSECIDYFGKEMAERVMQGIQWKEGSQHYIVKDEDVGVFIHEYFADFIRSHNGYIPDETDRLCYELARDLISNASYTMGDYAEPNGNEDGEMSSYTDIFSPDEAGARLFREVFYEEVYEDYQYDENGDPIMTSSRKSITKMLKGKTFNDMVKHQRMKKMKKSEQYELMLKDSDEEYIEVSDIQTFDTVDKAIEHAKWILHNRTDYGDVYIISIMKVDDFGNGDDVATYYRPNDNQIDAYNYVYNNLRGTVLDWIDDVNEGQESDPDGDADTFGFEFGHSPNDVLSDEDGQYKDCFTSDALAYAYIQIYDEYKNASSRKSRR